MLDLDIFKPVEEIPYINDNMILKPEDNKVKEVVKGPNIKPFPLNNPPEVLCQKVILKVGDNITTDHIMPSGAKLLPFRSKYHIFLIIVFPELIRVLQKIAEKQGRFYCSWKNYGQGSVGNMRL